MWNAYDDQLQLRVIMEMIASGILYCTTMSILLADGNITWLYIVEGHREAKKNVYE